MANFIPGVVLGEPTTSVVSIPASLNVEYPPRFTPKLRAGHFWMQDRHHYLYSRKASCYLEDITWYTKALVSEVLPGSETVYVKGIDVTGSGQYKFVGNKIYVNGASLSHPGTLIQETNYDFSLLDPLALGDVFNPDDAVKVVYDTLVYSAGTKAAQSILDPGTTIAGLLFEAATEGTWGNNIDLTINAAGGSTSITVAGNTVTLDYQVTDTVEDIRDLLNTSGVFTASDDGSGAPATDTFDDLLTAAGITLPDTLSFTGGTTPSYSTSTATEVFKLRETETIYQFPVVPKQGAPVVITDDRMEHFDRRDISPEFSINQDGILEFNVPENKIPNPDFNASPTEITFWITTGSPVISRSNSNFDEPYARSGKNFVSIPAASAIEIIVPAFNKDEQILSFAHRSLTGTITASLQFFDENWTSLGTVSQVTPAATSDWVITDYTVGPAGRKRSYSSNGFADASWVKIKLAATVGTVDVDYVFWGRGKLTPDHWHPHAKMTVEFEVSDSVSYEHQPLIVYDYFGDVRANQIPLESCNIHAVSNSNTNGFLYLYEYNDVTDFKLGLGGINSAPSVEIEQQLLLDWPNAPSEANPISDGAGGFYLSAAGVVSHVLADGTIDPDFSVTLSTGAAEMVLYRDTLYLGGAFTTVNGTSRARLAAVNAATGALLSWNPGSTVAINKIKITPDGSNILVAFSATGTVGGSSRECFAVIDTNGTATAFDASAAISGGDGLDIIWVDTNEIYCAGTFTTGAGIDYLARFDSTGTLDVTFDPGPSSTVEEIAVVDDKLYLVGAFTTVSATTRNRAARITIPAGILDTWDPNLNGTATTVAVDNGHVFIGGNFTTASGLPRTRAAKFSDAGAIEDWAPAFDALLINIVIGTEVLAVNGTFTTVDGIARDGIAFFKYYDNRTKLGRRHVPYAKLKSLGKLRQVSVLRYNALPWVKEVTELGTVPSVSTAQLINPFGLLTRSDNTITLGAAASVGDRELTLSDTTFLRAGTSYLEITEGSNTELVQIRRVISATKVELTRPLENGFSTIATTVATKRTLKIFESQDKFVRVRFLDQFRAGVGGYEPTILSDDISTLTVVGTDAASNRDGEFSVLINGLAAGTANLLIDDLELEVYVTALPTLATI